MDEPAATDSLTGAFDRSGFAASLDAALGRARTAGSVLTLAIIDVDHFKSINDAFGHARGDQILREVAQRMLHTLRGTDRLFRYGGDEFVLILQDASLEQAQTLVERLMSAVRDEKIAGNPPVRMTLSIGAASSDEIEGDIDAQALFERADARLYLSKRQGRNQLRTRDRDTASETAWGEEQHGGRMLERDGALADIRAFLDSLPARKRARLRVTGPAGSGRSRVLAEAGRHAALMGYEILALQGRPGYALRTHAAILEARAAGGLWNSLPHPLSGDADFVAALVQTLEARGASGLVLLVDGAEEIDRSTLALLRAVINCGEIVQLAVVACANGGLPQSLDCGLDQESALAAMTPGGCALWLRGMLKWEPPAEFAAMFHGLCDGLPGAMARRLQRLRELNLLLPGAESWTLDGTWHTALEGDAKNSARQVRNSPQPEEELIGREQELAQIKQTFKNGGLLTLAAPGGMGKTRLALQAAAELAGAFADGIHWISLSGIESSELMLPALLQAINLRLQGGAAPRRLLIERCRRSSMLLILDGFDSMMHDLGLIEEMTQASPDLRLLVTSREELRLPAERTLRLQGLGTGVDIGTAEGTNPAALGHAETLFLQQGRKALAEFSPEADDLPDISRICVSVGGLPLAIRLAAAWVTVFSCADIAGKLERDPEQANALSVINYFWSQLSESERQGARALAVCRGGFELSAAQKVAQVSPFFLSALVTKSFLVRNHGGRYDMQELLRQYSQRELSAHPQDWSKLRLVHGEYYLELVEQAALRWHGAEEVFWFARLTIELDNLRAALNAAVEDGRIDSALRMIAALANFWIGRGLILEGLRWTDLVLRQDGVDQSTYHASAIAAHGKLFFWSGQPEQSVRAFEQGLHLAQQAGSTVTIAVCQAWLAASLFRRGRHADALPLGERALIVARDAALRGEHALCLLTLGGILLERGDQAGARDHLTQCLAMFDQQGDVRRRTIALIFFGMLEFRDARLDEAKRTFIEAISLSLDNDDRLNYAFGLAHLGAVETAQGYRRDAHRRFSEAREILHQAGAYDWEALCLVHTAQAYLAVHDHGATRAALESALNCALDSRSVRRQLLVVAAFAQLAAAEGDAGRAGELAHLVLTHPDRGAEASMPARAALEACDAVESKPAQDDPAEWAERLSDCLTHLKRQAELATGT